MNPPSNCAIARKRSLSNFWNQENSLDGAIRLLRAFDVDALSSKALLVGSQDSDSWTMATVANSVSIRLMTLLAN